MEKIDDMVDVARKLLVGNRFDGLEAAEVAQAKYMLRAMFAQFGFATGELLAAYGTVSEKAMVAVFGVLGAAVPGVASAMNNSSGLDPDTTTIAGATAHAVTHIRRRGLHVVRNDESAPAKPKKPRKPRKPK